MNSEKDSNKEKYQGQEKKQQQNIQFSSPCPAGAVQTHDNLVLRDLTPLRSIYGTFQNSTTINLSNTDMAIINTPANNPSRNSLLHQIDEPFRQISLIMSFDNQPSAQSSQESDQDDFSYQSSKSISKNQQDQPAVQKIPLEIFQSSKKQPQLVINSEQPPQKLKRNIHMTPRPTTENQPSKRVFCNCKKTKCLKLYCDCFRDGQVCGDGCNCQGCHNLPNYEQLRNNSMWTLMERNPDAFKPKIQEQKHSKGCNCKKSHCQKKYCECFQANLRCGEHCRCQQCKNGECESHTNQKGKEDKTQLRTTAKKEKKYNEWAGGS